MYKLIRHVEYIVCFRLSGRVKCLTNGHSEKLNGHSNKINGHAEKLNGHQADTPSADPPLCRHGDLVALDYKNIPHSPKIPKKALKV